MQQFFALIRLGMGQAVDVDSLGDIDWKEIYALSFKHKMRGIIWAAINKLPKNRQPESKIYLKWLSQVAIIQQRNQLASKRALELSEYMKNKGFPGVLLKGQGLAQLYPDPSLRPVGDIDFWVTGHSRQNIIDNILSGDPNPHLHIHHGELHIFSDITVEIHFKPSYAYNKRHNRRLEEFCASQVPACQANTIDIAGGKVSVPTLRFNAVYLLSHIYRHVLCPPVPVSLKQLLDYYVVLTALKSSCPNWQADRESILAEVKHLGMKRICSAIMWVMQQVFGLSDDALIGKPNAVLGQELLDKILLDKRIKVKRHYTSEYPLSRVLRIMKLWTVKKLNQHAPIVRTIYRRWFKRKS